MTEMSRQEMSSPDQSPQHPWPMVPVLQTLTVLSDGEEELMEQKMGIENHVYMATKMATLDPVSFNLPPALNTVQKRKVGRPVTSLKTMNRSFPAVDEIRTKLEAGECYVRPRASSSSSDVWSLFQEVAYKETHFFTGIVQCKTCKFLTRYHGQITGTSHMRRHHCFSILFPNSMPATRKSKAANGTANNGGTPVDADSTTPRMLKKIKKEESSPKTSNVDTFGSLIPPLIAHDMNGSVGAMNNASNLTIHPSLPKKRLKNGHFAPQERSLMASANSFGVPVNTSIASTNGNQSQSMLRPVSNQNNGNNGNNNNNNNNNNSSSPSSSPYHAMSQASNLNVPSSVTNNIRINNSKQDLCERLVRFCCQELVPINSVNSEAFRSILQSHLRLCTTQLHQQLLQQQQQHPQLMTLTAMVSSFMNHLSHQMPDSEKLRTYLEDLYGHCRDKIRLDLCRSLEINIGGALVCDAGQDSCIISVYYVDNDWRLVEAVLSASAAVYDINQFVTKTLETYALQDSKKLSKFTFVSHGGLFDGVSLCLSSMSHIVDKVVEETLTTVNEIFARKKLPLLSDLFDNCHEIVTRSNLFVEPFPYDVEWVSKYEEAKAISERDPTTVQEENGLNMVLVSELVNILEPFKTASYELRQCFKHPTLSHVLLYFHKLKKVLAQSSESILSRHQTEPTNLSKKQQTKANGDVQETKVKKQNRAKSSDKSDQSMDDSDSDSNSEYEKEIDPVGVNIKQNGDDDCDDEIDHGNLNQTEQAILMLDHLKKQLLENLNRYYEVQSLHRIATFLWPNFRLLKMLSSSEQKEVHDEVRKLLQSRITVAKPDVNGNHSNGSCGSSPIGHDSSVCSANGMGGKNSANISKKSSDFDEWEILSDQDQDEVDKYLAVQLTSCSEDFVLQWWREHSIEFPKLSQLAKWILSIPASVTTRERFKINHNRLVDDLTLFLHCNYQNEKFDLNTIRKSNPKTKVKHTKNSVASPSSASLIAQQNN